MKINLITVFLFISSQSFAQQLDSLKSKNIIIQLGSGQCSFRDGVISPLLYSGLGFTGNISSQTETNKKTTRLGLLTNFGTLKNKFNNEASQFNASISYAKFYRFRRNSHWSWGVISNTQVYYRQFNSFLTISNASKNADVFSTLNPTISYQSALFKRGKVSAELNFPIIGVALNRKMYNAVTNPDIVSQGSGEMTPKSIIKTSELISLSKLKQVNLALFYQYPIGRKTSFSTTYSINAYQYERLNNYTQVLHSSLNAGFHFNLK